VDFGGILEWMEMGELDRYENDTTTNTKHPIGTFAVSRSGAYQYMRLQHIGKNGRGDNRLILDSFEIFGRLIE
jgi:hypothetical protein